MSRLARLVILGYPHHVTQRGNHRAQMFFEDGDGLRRTFADAHRRYTGYVMMLLGRFVSQKRQDALWRGME